MNDVVYNNDTSKLSFWESLDNFWIRNFLFGELVQYFRLPENNFIVGYNDLMEISQNRV